MYRIVDEALELQIELGDEPPEAIENADAWLILPDGSKWSITFLTYRELGRLMRRWATTGEYLGGAYFTCPDVVVVRDPGVTAMLAAVKDLVAKGEHELTLMKVD